MLVRVKRYSSVKQITLESIMNHGKIWLSTLEEAWREKIMIGSQVSHGHRVPVFQGVVLRHHKSHYIIKFCSIEEHSLPNIGLWCDVVVYVTPPERFKNALAAHQLLDSGEAQKVNSLNNGV